MKNLATFNFHQNAVRLVMQGDSPWFVAKDVCDALGYANSRDAVADHLDADEKGVANSDTLGGNQKLTIINESGLYALVLRSRKPEARKFAKWVTSEVLPSIRKTGGYGQDPLKHKQLLISVDHTGQYSHIQEVPRGSFVSTHERIADLIRITGDAPFQRQTVLEILTACMDRLGADQKRLGGLL